MSQDLNWGEFKDKLKFLKSRGHDVKIADDVELLPDLIPVWNAFGDLSGSRLVTMAGAQVIQFQEIAAWLDLNGYRDTTMRQSFVYLIRRLDQKFMEMRDGKTRSSDKLAKGKNRGG